MVVFCHNLICHHVHRPDNKYVSNLISSKPSESPVHLVKHAGVVCMLQLILYRVDITPNIYLQSIM